MHGSSCCHTMWLVMTRGKFTPLLKVVKEGITELVLFCVQLRLSIVVTQSLRVPDLYFGVYSELLVRCYLLRYFCKCRCGFSVVLFIHFHYPSIIVFFCLFFFSILKSTSFDDALFVALCLEHYPQELEMMVVSWRPVTTCFFLWFWPCMQALPPRSLTVRSKKGPVHTISNGKDRLPIIIFQGLCSRGSPQLFYGFYHGQSPSPKFNSWPFPIEEAGSSSFAIIFQTSVL